MFILFKALVVIALADFVTGVVHWLEDSYWSEDTPILGKWIVTPNLAHHSNGQAFLQKTWWQSSWDLILISGGLVLATLYFHHFTWEIALFAAISANANLIHRWAHMTDKNPHKPVIIRWMQKIYLLQTPMHHGQHHRKPNNSHYCTVTNWLNPLLDHIKFWRALETCFKLPTSSLRQQDKTINGLEQLPARQASQIMIKLKQK